MNLEVEKKGKVDLGATDAKYEQAEAKINADIAKTQTPNSGMSINSTEDAKDRFGSNYVPNPVFEGLGGNSSGADNKQLSQMQSEHTKAII